MILFSFLFAKSIIVSRIDFGRVKIFYFMSESLLEELLNINYFSSKSILTKGAFV